MKPEGSWTRVMFGFRARWSAMVAFQRERREMSGERAILGSSYNGLPIKDPHSCIQNGIRSTHKLGADTFEAYVTSEQR